MIRHSTLIAVTILAMSALGVASPVGRPSHHAVAQKSHGWIAADANPNHAWLYVTGYSNNVVDIRDLQRLGAPEIGEITDGVNTPNDVSVDNQGTVYVVNKMANNVTIYPAGQTTPSLTLSQGLTQPISAVTDANGDVYVSSRGNDPSIVVYPPGQTVPSETIRSSLIKVPAQLVFDPTGNLYFADDSAGISEIPLGSTQPVSLGLQGIAQASGLALDAASGQLYVSQAGAGPTLAFELGQTKAIRALSDSNDADLLAVGPLKGHDYLFLPHTTKNTVSLYKMRGRQALLTIYSKAKYPVGVRVKPAGVL